jgi:hypothetical protein
MQFSGDRVPFLTCEFAKLEPRPRDLLLDAAANLEAPHQ